MPPTAQAVVYDRRSAQRRAALACETDDIWNASQQQEEPAWGTARGFTYPPGSKNPSFFVKFTRSWSKWLLEPEQRNHKFAFNTLGRQQQPASPRLKLLVFVPEIFRVFEHREYYFLVMEFVPGRTLNELITEDARGGPGQAAHSTLYQYIAEGIRLLSVKAPPGAKPGPVGGGIIRHPLFKDFQAAVPYRDVKMLEAHMNNVIKLATYHNPDWAPTVTLEEDLQFYYSDLSSRNFIFNTEGDQTLLYIIDFDEAGFLPPSFMSFVLHSTARPTSIRVAEHVANLIEHNEDNLLALRTASYFLLSSIYYFGLPLEGYPETELAEVKRLKNERLG